MKNHAPVVCECRSETGDSALVLLEDGRHAYCDSKREDDCKSLLKPCGETLAAEEDAANQKKRRNRKQYFTGIDIIS